MDEDSDTTSGAQGDGGGAQPDATADPRDIAGQNQEHNAEARGAEIDLSPEEREEQIKSAAPDGGEIQDAPEWPAQEPERDEARAQQEDEARQRESGSPSGGEQGCGSRVSVVDESPPRPEPPDGDSDDEEQRQNYK